MQTNFYQHIERLNSDEVEGILTGTVYLFTKLDGTNIGIHFEDGEVKVNSRKRAISVDNDNAGSCKYVLNNPKFADYFKAHPQHYLYGEFLVKHTIRTYIADAWNKVYVFDVVDYSGDKPRYLSYEEYKPLLEEFDIEYIPLMTKLNDPTEDDIIEWVSKCNFLQPDDLIPGEGIVIKNYNYHNKYDRITWAKIVRTEFKAQKKQKTPITDIEATIIEQYMTVPFVEKELAKILNDIGQWDNKYISRCLNIIWHEFVVENSWDIIKKFKNPTIHFAMLYSLATEKIKSIMSSFFVKKNIQIPF